MVTMLLFSATGIHFLEREVQPDKFGSIPEAAWWAISTLTTVGYGDVAPVTGLGKLFGGVVMLIGLGMFALPIAIISTSFAQEVGRYDFVVTWSMLARIRLFAELDARSIAELMPYLHAHNYPVHWEVIAEGSEGESMFFIASGTIAVQTAGGVQILRTGDFFGEIAMLEQSLHQHAFTATSRARLLRLHREDFLRLERAHPDIGRHIRRVDQICLVGQDHQRGPRVRAPHVSQQRHIGLKAFCRQVHHHQYDVGGLHGTPGGAVGCRRHRPAVSSKAGGVLHDHRCPANRH